jgi:hypothetical protein
MARTKVDIDPERLGKLAQICCTFEECAAFFNTTASTIRNRIKREPYKSAWEKGTALARISIRRAQYQLATSEKPNPIMLIWLGKQYLEQTDKMETKVEERSSFVVELPPPMSADDWAAAFSPKAVTIDHEPTPPEPKVPTPAVKMVGGRKK